MPSVPAAAPGKFTTRIHLGAASGSITVRPPLGLGGAHTLPVDTREDKLSLVPFLCRLHDIRPKSPEVSTKERKRRPSSGANQRVTGTIKTAGVITGRRTNLMVMDELAEAAPAVSLDEFGSGVPKQPYPKPSRPSRKARPSDKTPA